MKKLLSLILICAGFQIAAAQKVQEVEKAQKQSISDERNLLLKEIWDVRKEQQEPVNSMLTANAVGEPDSFGKNIKFLGTAATGVVYVYHSCDPPVLLAELNLTLGADDRCLAHTVGGGFSTGTFDDLGRITIPAKAADNVIYFILNNTVSNDFRNDYANGFPAFFSYSPRLTIESAALNDPAAVHPTTGLPLNGVLTVSAFGAKIFNKIIPANSSDFSFDHYSSAATRGFARGYFADLGLPPSVINNLYKQPMTIKLGMRVSVRGVHFGQYLYAMRLTGN